MVFEHKSKTEIYKIPAIEPGSHVYFNDILGTNSKDIKNPIVGSWFRIEKGDESTPPKYDYDETGVVIEGTITLKDENGTKVDLVAGDTFVIHRGSTIAFSSKGEYGIAFKAGSRMKANL